MTLSALFIIGVPEKNVFLVSCQPFENITILPKHLCRTKKKLRPIPVSSDFGQHEGASQQKIKLN